MIRNFKNYIITEEKAYYIEIFKELNSLNKQISSEIKRVLSSKGEMPDYEVSEMKYGLQEKLMDSLNLLKNIR